MRFTETTLIGAFVVSLERREDDRGYFARAYCANEFADHGIALPIIQSNISRTTQRGTIRGLHLQMAPALEAKLVRCIRGAIFDVAADVRPDSPTFGQWVGVELTEDSGDALYVPEGCAHGFQTLTPDAAILYDASAPYDGAAATGVRYDDPVLGITWPLEATAVSAKDRAWPLLQPELSTEAARN